MSTISKSFVPNKVFQSVFQADRRERTKEKGKCQNPRSVILLRRSKHKLLKYFVRHECYCTTNSMESRKGDHFFSRGKCYE